ncbi:organic solute transporter Ostalpha-domain-containing protein [Lasiosphaeria ovina]|uniref:Organic solute transporter Ostalpha-domain-containing protein n=1 Tax=Lasiosphaeria ovina TaxID=92902 RepID=A0AAE0N900_9PEZI|nr:organic solute transporter Ostalpha-domain-containing protein [Lasiosphaeria ovina]
MNFTCNSTLEDLRILPGSEKIIVGDLNFHELALIIAAVTAGLAIIMSLYLIMMHAMHYTMPHEQKHIIRILFMIPVYATSSYLSLRYYWHAIYFQVLSDAYEAFAISSFFSLLCHYIKPDLHEQKDYFRDMQPIVPWVWPLNWFAKCCGGERGPWRTPRSGLTWFNIIWIGIYHYCFIRVAMTISAVGSQYFHRYCESSNSPVFGKIWITTINALAVTIAMYCVIQFYVQLRNTEQLKPNQPFLKVLSIKLVIFLSFWQSTAISLGTSTLNLVHPGDVLAYPDIKVGIPSLLLCVEMAAFAVLHLWAFPWRVYSARGGGAKQGGFLGLRALWEAVFIWDVVKGFGRGMRWLFVGVKHRHIDVSYQAARKDSTTAVNMDDLSPPATHGGGSEGKGGSPFYAANTSYGGGIGMSQSAASSTAHLPIAQQFLATRFGGNGNQSRDERAGLIQNAQPYYHHDPTPFDGHGSPPSNWPVPDAPLPPPQQLYYNARPPTAPVPFYEAGGRRNSLSTVDEEAQLQPRPQSSSRQHSRSNSGSRHSRSNSGNRHGAYDDDADYSRMYNAQQPQPQSNPRNSTQLKIGNALWGQRGPPPPGR